MNNITEINMKADQRKTRIYLTDIRERRIQRIDLIKRIIPPLYHRAKLRDFPKNIQLEIVGKNSIYLWGGVGVGKTYAAMAVARATAISRNSFKFVIFDELLAEIRSDFNKEDFILKRLENYDLLILDDIGLSGSEFASRILLRIINNRLLNLKKVIITANLPLEQIEALYGQRIKSRLQTYRIIKLDGKDRRGR